MVKLRKKSRRILFSSNLILVKFRLQNAVERTFNSNTQVNFLGNLLILASRVFSKNPRGLKTRALVLHEDKTYCSRNCMELNGAAGGRLKMATRSQLKSYGGRTMRAQKRKYL